MYGMCCCASKEGKQKLALSNILSDYHQGLNFIEANGEIFTYIQIRKTTPWESRRINYELYLLLHK